MWYKVTQKVTNIYFVEADSDDKAIKLTTTGEVAPVLGAFDGPVKEDLVLSIIKDEACMLRAVKSIKKRARLEECRRSSSRNKSLSKMRHPLEIVLGSLVAELKAAELSKLKGETK
jgi:hypothetical protein